VLDLAGTSAGLPLEQRDLLHNTFQSIGACN
jgi:hypothetical protein